MRVGTARRIAQAIQLLHLDGQENYTYAQVSKASGIASKTLYRNKDIVQILDFAINNKRYQRCLIAN